MLVFGTVAVMTSLTRAPWWDEGGLADPARNLAFHGYLGTSIQPATGHPIVRKFVEHDRYTYWTTPGYLVSLAAWLKLIGFSVAKMRLLSVVTGLVLLAAWGIIATALFRDRWKSLLAVALIATDYQLLTAASQGRPDCMAAALGFSGIAAYLYRREKHPRRALLVAALLTACAVYTHPVGLLHSLGLGAVLLALDRGRPRLLTLGLIAVPYAALTLLWAIYAAQAPTAFWSQISGHSEYRVGGFVTPFQAVVSDFGGRYMAYYYTGLAGPLRLKAVVLVAYVAATALVLAIRALRRQCGSRILLALVGLYYCGLAVIDSKQRAPHYFVHITPIVATVLAIPLYHAIRGHWKVWSVAGASIAIGLAGLQLGAIGLKVWVNPFQRCYLPVVNYVRHHADRQRPVYAGSEFFFELEPEFTIVDDARLGFPPTAAPQIIVRNSYYPPLSYYDEREPATARHLRRVLQKDYRLVQRVCGFSLYEENASVRR